MFIKKIKRLRKKGFSYREIASLVNKSSKFVYSNAKDVKFNRMGEKRYNKEVKGITKKIKNQHHYLTSAKVRIIGHLLFDGTLYKLGYHYCFKYISSSKDLIDQFILDIRKVYGILPSSLEIYDGKKVSNCYKVGFKSKLAFQDLKKYFVSYSTANNKISIPEEIINSKKEIKLEFLKSFFEDEGSISQNGRIMGDLKSEKIIKQISEILREFGLEFRICKYKQYTGYMWKIYLPKNKKNLEQFYRLNLFEKSTITNGYNIGKKKLEILEENLMKMKRQHQRFAACRPLTHPA